MKQAKELPPISYLKECFTISECGKLIWKDRPKEHFGGWYGYSGWNKKYAGKCADVDMRNGYYSVCINAIRYKSHRVVFAIVNGFIDNNLQIDHINGNGKDNRIENLRLATQSQNTINFKGDRADRKSGKRGVTWNKHNKKWEARIFKNGKCKSLGLFVELENAYEVASKARLEAFGEFWESQNV